MVIPTAAQIRDWSDVEFSEVGNGSYGDDDALDRLIAVQGAFFEFVTGYTVSNLPSRFEPLAQQVLMLLVEDAAFQTTAEIAEMMADWQLIASFTAGPYSETRRSMDELKKSGMIVGDPRIHQLLWMMLTDDMRDQWLGWLGGVNLPAFEVSEVDWSGRWLAEPFGSRTVYEAP